MFDSVQRNSRGWLLTTTVAVLCSAVMLAYFSVRFGLNSPPSATGDEPSYDSLAWQMSLGNGFREDYDNPDFRRPYDQAATQNPELMTLIPTQAGTITYRPPLFPMVIAATNILFGRQLWAIRVCNVMAMCITGALIFHFLKSHAGWTAAVLSLLLYFVLDVRVRLYSRAILTEALAVLLTTLMTLLLIRLLSRRTLGDAILAGLVLGLSVLNRTAFLLWLPGLAAGMLLLAWLHPQGAADLKSSQDLQISATAVQPRRLQTRWQSAFHILGPLAVVMGCAVLVYAPWAVRNCVVLGRFMPMGTQGMMELSAAFSDQAVNDQGVWFNLGQLGFFDSIDQPGSTRIEQELARADFSKSTAMKWISDHPGQAMMLAPMKIYHEYRPRTALETVIFVLMLTGLCVSLHKASTGVFLMLHAVNMLMIAGTWSVEGRFVVPLLFSIHIMAATGLVWLIQRTGILGWLPVRFRSSGPLLE